MHFLELVLSGEVKDYSAGITLHRARSGLLELNLSAEVGGPKQVLAGGEEKLSAIRTSAHLGRSLLSCLALRCGALMCGRFSRSLRRNGSGFDADITGCDDVFDVVLSTKMKGRLLSLHIAGFAPETRLVEDNLSRFIGDDPVLCLDDCSVRACNFEMNL